MSQQFKLEFKKWLNLPIYVFKNRVEYENSSCDITLKFRDYR